MKRKGAIKIIHNTEKLTQAQELQYWKQGTSELTRQKEKSLNENNLLTKK